MLMGLSGMLSWCSRNDGADSGGTVSDRRCSREFISLICYSSIILLFD